MNTYDPEAGITGRRFSTYDTTSCCRQLRAALGQGPEVGSDASARPNRRLHRRLEDRRHFPVPHGFPDYRRRRPRPVASGTRGNERPNCVGDPARPIRALRRDSTHSPAAPACSTSTRLQLSLSARSGSARSAWHAHPDTRTSTPRSPKHFNTGGARLRVPCRSVQPDQHAELRSAGPRYLHDDHLWPDHQHRQRRAHRWSWCSSSSSRCSWSGGCSVAPRAPVRSRLVAVG